MKEHQWHTTNLMICDPASHEKGWEVIPKEDGNHNGEQPVVAVHAADGSLVLTGRLNELIYWATTLVGELLIHAVKTGHIPKGLTIEGGSDEQA